MCGLVGIFDTRGTRSFDRGQILRMNDRIAHRGPDDFGTHLEPGLALGHRRLAIIDLSPAGHQPMENDAGDLVIVFNGEIFNFMEVRAELEALGHRFRTHSDTEVILHGWTEWGEKCLDRFRGMFAIVLWDRKQEVLFLARDRLGIKPLYYAQMADGRIAFASELKSLLEIPDLPRDLDPMAVEDYFAYGYIPDPKSILKSVRKLAPGHLMLQRRGASHATSRPYWDVTYKADPRLNSHEAVKEALIPLLQDAIRLRLVSDVPLGAFLSGGVDSGAVVAMMAGMMSDPVNTYAIGFEHRDYDERRYAQEVADRYHTRHTTRVVNPDDFDLVDHLAALYDEPFADSSAMPTYRVCGLAREHVTVALSGDGGDELFAGYRRHRWHSYEQGVRDRLPLWLRRPVFGTLGKLYPKLDWAPKVLRAKTTFESISYTAAEAYFNSVSVLPNRTRPKLFSSAFRSSLQGYNALSVLRGVMDNAPVEHELSRVQYADLKTYLPGDILTKVDRASMAHGLEARVPLLDHKFVEFTATIPPELLLDGRQGKMAFKKSLEPYLSHETLYRDKMGFAVPLESWFRGPLKDKIRQAVQSPVLADSGFFDQRYLTRLVDEHQSGRSNHSASLWAILMFQSSLKHLRVG
ncbi:XrtA/PEP-CTERM system amidotransferase [Govanella unica]|uniref:asparagine synthase (glutamine-hydrolyzing) n=1 Tax=Govanella unica TaxID=2975056 RepID=A0A9X3Z721_9PROT|nr:XrtA/PEP-CTERM system amidotransferase [Govania unica]MDA5193608.1 amidotransferase 1, exosortase A system-associated [Govania unica]